MAVAGIPAGFFGGETPDLTAQAWVLGIELGLLWLAGVWILITHLRRRGADEVEPMTPFARIYPAAYLAVMAVLWVGALPGFLDATDGITPDGTPIGSGLYTIACFLGASAILAVFYSGRHGARRRADVAAG